MRELRIVFWCVLTAGVHGQFLVEQPQDSPQQLNQGQALGAGAVIEDMRREIESLKAELNPTTNQFPFNGDNLLEHLADDHQAMPYLRALHERLHQAVERLRPPGIDNFIVVDATEDEFASFMAGYGGTLPAKGWVVLRRDRRPDAKLANIIAIGRVHFSHVGMLTRERLQTLIDQSKNRSRTPPKVSKWKISKIVMHTQESCAPCKQWKARDLAAVRADGVEFEEQPPDDRNTPAFDVTYCNGEQCTILRFGNVAYATMKAMRL